ncbi:hypothetical protein GALMADRAFT_229955 [Galerina marginata CBS 339.88]|uniref:Uncharacterized protein n=1 Tax=Galerina marginata (strain CBS 339.88) TaxID=685588 RepID=A0A067SKL3_GALM3|nr:hypothetical protein GALMADRAFT_229955 [Galerina marginata CBS 339.88]
MPTMHNRHFRTTACPAFIRVFQLSKPCTRHGRTVQKIRNLTCSRTPWDAATKKVEEYYNKTATSHAFTFDMLLDPDTEMNHFKKHWSQDLQNDILKSAENIFKERYVGESGAPQVTAKKGNKRLARLLAEDSSDDEMDASSTSTPPLGPEAKALVTRI